MIVTLLIITWVLMVMFLLSLWFTLYIWGDKDKPETAGMSLVITCCFFMLMFVSSYLLYQECN